VREIAERLALAEDLTTVGEALADGVASTIPFGSFNFAVFEPNACAEPFVLVRSNEFAPEFVAAKFAESVFAIETDLGGLTAALSETGAYDGYVKFPFAEFEDTSIIQDYWRPLHVDQQLVAPLWYEGTPVGYSGICRTRREARFTSDDLRHYEELRVHAERAVSRIATLKSGRLSQTLEMLTSVFPYPAFLFEGAGRLRWASGEGLVRLGVHSARVGAKDVLHGNAALDGLSRCATLLARDLAEDGQSVLRGEAVLRRGERVVVRRFFESGKVLLLIALVPAMASLRGEKVTATGTALPGLGSVESEVARLAAEGYTVLNIAVRLAVCESTVRTHLRRVYTKLGVHGRAGLASLMLRGSE
jgi:DNA-binding CsgD family transcriptional regulator